MFLTNRRHALFMSLLCSLPTMALAEADAGDVVVVAGKGHEDYQVVGTETRPFSDRAVVLGALGEEA